MSLPGGEAHTIGGYVANKLRRIPEVGDSVEEDGYILKVLEADARSVIKVRLERI